MEQQATYTKKITLRCSAHGEFVTRSGDCPACEREHSFFPQVIEMPEEEFNQFKVAANLEELKIQLAKHEKTRLLIPPDEVEFGETKIRLYLVEVNYFTLKFLK